MRLEELFQANLKDFTISGNDQLLAVARVSLA